MADAKKGLTFGLVASPGLYKTVRFTSPLADYLTERLGEPVRTEILGSFVEVAAALAGGTLSCAWIAPLTYARAAEGLQLLVRSVRRDAGSYHGALFTRADGPIQALEDLRGKKVAWVARDSVSGYVLPALALSERRVQPGAQAFLGTHATVVRAVASGTADAGATFCTLDPRTRPPSIVTAGWQETVDVGQARFRALEFYGPIPSDVVCATPTLARNLRERLVSALERIHETPAGQEMARGLFGADRFVQAEPQEYFRLRLAMDRLGR